MSFIEMRFILVTKVRNTVVHSYFIYMKMRKKNRILVNSLQKLTTQSVAELENIGRGGLKSNWNGGGGLSLWFRLDQFFPNLKLR